MSQEWKNLAEAALFVAERALSPKDLQQSIFAEHELSLRQIRQLLAQIAEDYHGRGIHLVETAAGFRFQTKQEYQQALRCLWQPRPSKLSRAQLETLTLIAYRQPITRGEIEAIRGVAVSSNIIQSLLQKGWVQKVGHKEVAGRPALFATTTAFLDSLGLQKLEQLPVLDQSLLEKLPQDFQT